MTEEKLPFQNSEESSDVSDTDDSISDLESEDSSDQDETERTEAPTNNDIDAEEDDLIKAIRKELNKRRTHPPNIECEELITDICFHPVEDYIAVAQGSGDVILYKYTNEENNVFKKLELHTESIRDVEFNNGGSTLYSISVDKSIMLTDLETSKLKLFYDETHDVNPNCLCLLEKKNIFASGDEDGCVKIWDSREPKYIFEVKENEDYISQMLSNDEENYLVCTSADGTLATIDLRQRKLFVRSEEYDEEFLCMSLMRQDSKLVVGTSAGNLYTFNWGEFALHANLLPLKVGNKTAPRIDAMLPITDLSFAIATDDGNISAKHLFPERHLGIVGQHKESVDCLDISNNGSLIASSDDSLVKFWKINYFKTLQVSQTHDKNMKRKEMKYNLPSSKRQNVTDFFKGLAS